jgi:hypothetical protein
VLASYITTLGRGPVLPMVVRTAIFAGFFVPVSQWSQSRKPFVLRVVQKVKIIYVRMGTLHLGNLNPREWRYLTPEVVAILKGKSDSKTTGKTSAKPVQRTAPKTRANTETKVGSRPTSKSAPKPGPRTTRKAPAGSSGSLRLHHPERIGPRNRGPMVENSAA